MAITREVKSRDYRSHFVLHMLWDLEAVVLWRLIYVLFGNDSKKCD